MFPWRRSSFLFIVGFSLVSVRNKGIVSVHNWGPSVRTVKSPDPELAPTLSSQQLHARRR